MCCICFFYMQPDECYTDAHQQRWDLHPGRCAHEAGMTARDQRERIHGDGETRDDSEEDRPHDG